MEGKPGEGEQPAKVELLTDRQLSGIERSNHGPSKGTISRLIAGVRAYKESSEERGWRVVELETQLERAKDEAKENAKQRTLIVVETDGFIQVFADASVTLKIVTVKPWQDSHEMAMDEKSHWSEIWWPNKPRATARPNYLSEPNRVSVEAIADVMKWKASEEFVSAVKDFRGMIEVAKERQAVEAVQKLEGSPQ